MKPQVLARHCPEVGAQLRRLFLDNLPPGADSFARSRFEEGERTVELLRVRFPELFADLVPRVLDLGSGNGGMLFPFAVPARAIALDTYVDADLRRFKTATGLQVDQVCASASALPFHPDTLDVVLLAEVIEHLGNPRVAAKEIMRVLRPGGVCLVSTPPRLKFLHKRDPHFDIPFLLLFPDGLQRRIAGRLRRERYCYVDHIYTTTWGLHHLFPHGSCSMHVISHRRGWTKNLSWNYIAFQKVPE
jgi:SAM-dependent methyltransferase